MSACVSVCVYVSLVAEQECVQGVHLSCVLGNSGSRHLTGTHSI